MSAGAGPTDPGEPGTGSGLAPGAIFAGLVIEGEIGRGGMGVIYRVRDPELDRIRALKVLAAERSAEEEFRERFRRESRQAASIEHENVVPVYRAGQEQGQLFLLMRFVDGPSLADLLAQTGPLPLDDTVELIRQVAAGLDAAHAAGLIHRDIKPANILLEGEGSRRRAFLGDFGISKLTTDAADLTSTGRFIGTVDYVAPEQLEGGALDARADVYSLACVAYHALAGEPPFRRETQLATMFAHANAPRPAPQGMPSGVVAALADGMAVRPDDRPGSAGEFARTLERAAGTASVAPTRDMAKPGRPKRRRVWLFAGAILAAAVAAAAVLLLGDGEESEPPPAITAERPVRVAKRPLGVAVGPQRAWVVSPISGVVTALAPGENTLVLEKAIRAEPVAVAVGLGAVWAVDRSSGELLQIDPDTGNVTDRTPVGASPADVAIGEQYVWVAGAGTDSIRAIDPTTGEEADRLDQIGDEPVALAIADGTVWVVNRAGRTVVRIAEEGGDRVGNATPVGSRPSDVAADADAAWVSDNADGTVTRVDPATGDVVGETAAVGVQPRALAIGLGYVWVANGDGTVARLDPDTADLVGEPISVGSDAADVAIGKRGVWVADFGESTVTELLPEE